MGNRVSASASEGIGLSIPERRSDCTGQHPSWYPFQNQVDACEGDAPDPVPLTARHLSIGPPKSGPAV